MKFPWFSFAPAKVGGGASLALFNKGLEIQSASTSSTGTSIFERCYNYLGDFIHLMQREPREREARY